MRARNKVTRLVVALSAASGLLASEITVQTHKVRDGSFAATLALSSSCTSPNHLELTGAISGGIFQACSGLDADGELSGDVVLEAGKSITFGAGLRVARGSTLTARLAPSLSPDALLVDGSPQFEASYTARLWVNTDDFTPNDATRFDHFLAFDWVGDQEFSVVVRQGSAGPEVFLEVIDDNGTRHSTAGSPLTLPSTGWHSIQLVWTRASGADDGSAEVCVDVTNCTSLSGLDNDTGLIHQVRWGAHDLEGGAAGAIHLDGFESLRGAGPME